MAKIKHITELCLLIILMFFPILTKAAFSQDREITRVVYNILEKEKDIPKVKVLSKNRVVKLVGVVDTNLQANHMTELASSVNGVKYVNTDKLQVKNSKEFLSDAFITAKAKGKIKYLDINDRISSGHDLHIETTNKVVHIWGKVTNKKDIKTIKDSIENIIDVDAVKSNIEHP